MRLQVTTQEMEMEVGGTMVEMLMRGSRPSRSDLFVLLDANMLDAVISALATDVNMALGANESI